LINIKKYGQFENISFCMFLNYHSHKKKPQIQNNNEFFFNLFKPSITDVIGLLLWGKLWLVFDTCVCMCGKDLSLRARAVTHLATSGTGSRLVLTLRSSFVTDCNHRATPSHIIMHYIITKYVKDYMIESKL